MAKLTTKFVTKVQSDNIKVFWDDQLKGFGLCDYMVVFLSKHKETTNILSWNKNSSSFMFHHQHIFMFFG